MHQIQHKLSSLGAVFVFFSAIAVTAHAAEFRSRNAIPTPHKVASTPLPEGAQPVEKIQPVPRQAVTQAVESIFSSYGNNTAALQSFLGQNFQNKDRLLDNLVTNAPADATLTVQGVRSVQTLNQYIQPGGNGTSKRVSTVSAVVAGQIEFNDPVAGVQRRQGTAQYTLQITERLRSQ